jgi:hypothetical protein
MQQLMAAFGPGSEAEAAAAVYNGGLDLLDQDAAAFPKQLVALKEALAGAGGGAGAWMFYASRCAAPCV